MAKKQRKPVNTGFKVKSGRDSESIEINESWARDQMSVVEVEEVVDSRNPTRKSPQAEVVSLMNKIELLGSWGVPSTSEGRSRDTQCQVPECETETLGKRLS